MAEAHVRENDPVAIVETAEVRLVEIAVEMRGACGMSLLCAELIALASGDNDKKLAAITITPNETGLHARAWMWEVPRG